MLLRLPRPFHTWESHHFGAFSSPARPAFSVRKAQLIFQPSNNNFRRSSWMEVFFFVENFEKIKKKLKIPDGKGTWIWRMALKITEVAMMAMFGVTIFNLDSESTCSGRFYQVTYFGARVRIWMQHTKWCKYLQQADFFVSLSLCFWSFLHCIGSIMHLSGYDRTWKGTILCFGTGFFHSSIMQNKTVLSKRNLGTTLAFHR